MIALEHSMPEAEILGNGREIVPTLNYYFRGGDDSRTDTYRDLYNNAVGRAIGACARQNGLSQNDVANLVDHAIQSGQAIVSIRLNDPDPRIPFIDSTFPRLFRTPGLFNGWPGDFRNIPDIWTPPQPAGSGGILVRPSRLALRRRHDEASK